MIEVQQTQMVSADCSDKIQISEIIYLNFSEAEDEYIYEGALEIFETSDDNTNDFSITMCPQDNNSFRIRKNRIKQVGKNRQFQINPKNQEYFSSE